MQDLICLREDVCRVPSLQQEDVTACSFSPCALLSAMHAGLILCFSVRFFSFGIIKSLVCDELTVSVSDLRGGYMAAATGMDGVVALLDTSVTKGENYWCSYESIQLIDLADHAVANWEAHDNAIFNHAFSDCAPKLVKTIHMTSAEDTMRHFPR